MSAICVSSMKLVRLFVTLLPLLKAIDSIRAAEEKPAGTFSSDIPELPEDPFQFPKRAPEQLQRIATATSEHLHLPLSISGPYSVEHLTWITEHGKTTVGSRTLERGDYLDAQLLAQLKEMTTENREVYFYSWQSDNGVWSSAQTGFVIIEQDSVVAEFTTRTLG